MPRKLPEQLAIETSFDEFSRVYVHIYSDQGHHAGNMARDARFFDGRFSSFDVYCILDSVHEMSHIFVVYFEFKHVSDIDPRDNPARWFSQWLVTAYKDVLVPHPHVDQLFAQYKAYLEKKSTT